MAAGPQTQTTWLIRHRSLPGPGLESSCGATRPPGGPHRQPQAVGRVHARGCLPGVQTPGNACVLCGDITEFCWETCCLGDAGGHCGGPRGASVGVAVGTE